MNNFKINYNPDDLYIILSSIQSQDEEQAYSLEDLKRYVLKTENMDGLICLLEFDGNFLTNESVRNLVNKKIEENPDSARAMHLKAHKQAIIYTRNSWGNSEVDTVRAFIKNKNRKAKEIADLDKEIAQYDGNREFANLLESLDEKKGRRNLKYNEYSKYEIRLKRTNCESLYKKAMLAYDEEAKGLTPAQAQVNKAKAHLINVSYLYGEQTKYQFDQLLEASARVPSLELRYYKIMCEIADKKIDFNQSVEKLEEIADQDLSQEGEKAIELGENSDSNADEMAE